MRSIWRTGDDGRRLPSYRSLRAAGWIAREGIAERTVGLTQDPLIGLAPREAAAMCFGGTFEEWHIVYGDACSPKVWKVVQDAWLMRIAEACCAESIDVRERHTNSGTAIAAERIRVGRIGGDP